MLYNIFKWLFFLTVKGYFRSIYIKGYENVPKEGPVIFAANHNSAFMDPILLAVHIQQKVYFLARGEAFRSKLISFIFRLLNMIPVYRPEVTPEKMHKNKEVFQKCYDHLKKNKSIIIFPEGFSKTERKLRRIKTGLARIALGAEDQNDFKLGLHIVPIGINYSNPHYFRSDVFIHFGKPFTITEYEQLYKEDEKEAVLQLTESLKSNLEKLVVIVEDEKLDKLIRKIEILYRSKLRDESKPGEKAPQDFYLSKEIVKAVQYYQSIRPEQKLDFEIKIDRYLKNLKKLKIRDTQLRSSRVPIQMLSNTLYFILGAPLFIYGYLVNIIPYLVAKLLSRKIIVRKDFLGSIKLAFGMFIFLIFYIIEFIVFASFTNIYWGILFVLSLYPAGVFTINFIKTYYLMRGSLRYVNLFLRNSNLVTKLKLERKELVDMLEEGRALFLESLNAEQVSMAI